LGYYFVAFWNRELDKLDTMVYVMPMWIARMVGGLFDIFFLLWPVGQKWYNGQLLPNDLKPHSMNKLATCILAFFWRNTRLIFLTIQPNHCLAGITLAANVLHLIGLVGFCGFHLIPKKRFLCADDSESDYNRDVRILTYVVSASIAKFASVIVWISDKSEGFAKFIQQVKHRAFGADVLVILSLALFMELLFECTFSAVNALYWHHHPRTLPNSSRGDTLENHKWSQLKVVLVTIVGLTTFTLSVFYTADGKAIYETIVRPIPEVLVIFAFIWRTIFGQPRRVEWRPSHLELHAAIAMVSHVLTIHHYFSQIPQKKALVSTTEACVRIALMLTALVCKSMQLRVTSPCKILVWCAWFSTVFVEIGHLSKWSSKSGARHIGHVFAFTAFVPYLLFLKDVACEGFGEDRGDEADALKPSS